MRTTKSLLVAGLVLASCVIAASSRAASIGRTDYLTMNRATALPGVVLPAGQYVFEIYTGFTEIVRRPAGVSNSLTFGEAPSGEPIPIRTWFPSGLSRGLAFKH